MKAIATTLLLTTLIAQSANSPKWELISTTEDPQKITSWYVDINSIVREDDYMRAVLRTSWSIPQYGPDNTDYQSTTYINYIDCVKNKIAYTGNTYFKDAESTGVPVHAEPEQPLKKLKFQSVVQGSAGANRLNFVCKFFSKNFMTMKKSSEKHSLI
jgi:hypothetical protein